MGVPKVLVTLSLTIGLVVASEEGSNAVCEAWHRQQRMANCADDDAKLSREARRQGRSDSLRSGGCAAHRLDCYRGDLQGLVSDACLKTCGFCAEWLNNTEPTGCCYQDLGTLMRPDGTRSLSACRAKGQDYGFAVGVSCDELYGELFQRPCADADGSCEGTEWLKRCHFESQAGTDHWYRTCPATCGVCDWYAGTPEQGCCFLTEEIHDMHNDRTAAASRHNHGTMSAIECRLEVNHGYARKLFAANTSCWEPENDNCGTQGWPSKDRGIICGPCKVPVSHYGSTCEGYCGGLGRSCVSAARTDWEQRCAVSWNLSCTDSADHLLCECSEEANIERVCNSNEPPMPDLNHILDLGSSFGHYRHHRASSSSAGAIPCDALLKTTSCDQALSAVCPASTPRAKSGLTVGQLCPEQCGQSCPAAGLAQEPAGDVYNCIVQKNANLDRATEDFGYDKASAIAGICLAAKEYLACLPSGCCGMHPDLQYQFSSVSTKALVLSDMCNDTSFPCPPPAAPEPCPQPLCGTQAFLPNMSTTFYHDGRFRMTCENALMLMRSEHRCEDTCLRTRMKRDCCDAPIPPYSQSKCEETEQGCWGNHNDGGDGPQAACKDNYTVVTIPDSRSNYEEWYSHTCKLPGADPDPIPPWDYYYFSLGLTWQEAKAHCQGLGLQLASICTGAEKLMVEHVKHYRHHHGWIGLTDAAQEGNWTWSGGASCPVLWWQQHEHSCEQIPRTDSNRNCAAWSHGGMEDYDCNERKSHYCMGNLTEYLLRTVTCPAGWHTCIKCCDVDASCRCDSEWSCQDDQHTPSHCSLSHDWRQRSDPSACLDHTTQQPVSCCSANASCAMNHITLKGATCPGSSVRELHCLPHSNREENYICANDTDWQPEAHADLDCYLNESARQAISKETCCSAGGVMQAQALKDGTYAFLCQLHEHHLGGRNERVAACLRFGGTATTSHECKHKGRELQPGVDFSPEMCSAPPSAVYRGELRNQDSRPVSLDLARFSIEGLEDRCCSGGPLHCSEADGPAGVCQDPSSWDGDRLLQLSCYGITRDACCGLKGSWHDHMHDSDSDQCMQSPVSGAGECHMNARDFASVGSDMRGACVAAGGVPRDPRTCHRAARDVDERLKMWVYGIAPLTAANCTRRLSDSWWERDTVGSRLEEEFSPCCGSGAMKCFSSAPSSAEVQVCKNPSASRNWPVRVYCAGVTQTQCCDLGDWEDRSWDGRLCETGVCRIERHHHQGEDVSQKCIDAGGWLHEVRRCSDEFDMVARAFAMGHTCDDPVPWEGGDRTLKRYMQDMSNWLRDTCCADSLYACSGSEDGSAGSSSSSVCTAPEMEVSGAREIVCEGISQEACCQNYGSWHEDHHHSSSPACAGSPTSGARHSCRFRLWEYGPGIADLCTSLGGTPRATSGTCATDLPHEWREGLYNCSAQPNSEHKDSIEGIQMPRTMVRSIDWHAMSCCSNKVSKCEIEPSWLSKTSQVCKNPDDFRPDHVRNVQCVGISNDKCCELGGSLSESGDYTGCAREGESQDGRPTRPGSCNLEVGDRVQGDPKELCEAAGGRVLWAGTCSREAYDFAMLYAGDCEARFAPHSDSGDTFKSRAGRLAEAGCCGPAGLALCSDGAQSGDSQSPQVATNAAAVCSSGAYNPSQVWRVECTGPNVTALGCCKAGGEFESREDHSGSCVGSVYVSGSVGRCNLQAADAAQKCTDMGGWIREAETCLAVARYVIEPLLAAGYAVNSSFCGMNLGPEVHFSSTYPTGASIMGIWNILGCCGVDGMDLCSAGGGDEDQDLPYEEICSVPDQFQHDLVVEATCRGLSEDDCCQLGGHYSTSAETKGDRCEGGTSTITVSECHLQGEGVATQCTSLGGTVHRSRTCGRMVADGAAILAEAFPDKALGQEMCGSELLNDEFGSEYSTVDQIFKAVSDWGCCGVEMGSGGEVVKVPDACAGMSLQIQGTPCMLDEDFQRHSAWSVQCRGMSSDQCRQLGGEADGCSCKFEPNPGEPMRDPVGLCEMSGFTAHVETTCEQVYHRYWAVLNAPILLADYTTELCDSFPSLLYPEPFCSGSHLPNWTYSNFSSNFADMSGCCSPDPMRPGRHKCMTTTTTTTPTPDRALTLCSSGLPSGAEFDATACRSRYLEDTCLVSCSERFEGAAAAYVCGASNAFAGSPPDCALRRCNVSGIAGLLAEGRQWSYAHDCGGKGVGESCGVSCPADYEFPSGTTTLFYSCSMTSASAAFLGPPLESCRRKRCEIASQPRAMGVDPTACSDTEVGANCTLPCQTGFSGSATSIACGADLAFVGAAPVCTQLPCALEQYMQEPVVTHTCSNVYLHQTCSTFCRRGYRADVDVLHSTCAEDSGGVAFQKDPPDASMTCTGIPCERHIPFGVGMDSAQCVGKVTGESCSLSCMKGYETSDVASPACQDDQSFASYDFRCHPKVCGDIATVSSFEHSLGVEHTCDGRKYKQSCLAFCRWGFTMTGSDKSLLCDDDANNAGFIMHDGSAMSGPACTPKPCIYGIPSTTGISHTCTGVATSETCTADAAGGYEIVTGEAVTLTCQPSGVLVITGASGLPRVQPMQCSDLAAEPGVANNCVGKRVGQTCWKYCAMGYSGSEPVVWQCSWDGSSTTFTGASIACSNDTRRLDEDEGEDAVMEVEVRSLTTAGPCDGTLGSISGTGVTSDCQGKVADDVCIVACEEGYTIQGGAKVWRCDSADNTFKTSYSPELPTCNPNICSSDLPDGLGVTHNCASTGTASTCTATCGSGYVLAENEIAQTFVCHQNGSFTGVAPVCQLLECSLPESPPAEYDYASCNGTLYGQRCGVECAQGYVGDAVAVSCQASGQLEDSLPTCTPQSCEGGLPPASAEFVVDGSCSGLTTGQTCQVSCAAGFLGSSTVFECTKEGIFAGSPPSCQPAKCPDEPSTATVDSSCMDVSLGDICTQSCPVGYIGAATQRTCGLLGGNLALLGAAPTCEPQACTYGLPLSPAFLAESKTACATLRFGQSCELKCAPGYTTGESTLECGADAYLSGALPECVPSVCADLSVVGAKASCDGIGFGSSCEADCLEEGYTRRSMYPRVLTCSLVDSTLQLTGRGLECDPKVCTGNLPPSFPFQHSCAGKGYMQTCEVGCRPGFSGAGANFTCEINGNFSGTLPDCSADCGELEECDAVMQLNGTLKLHLSSAITADTVLNAGPAIRQALKAAIASAIAVEADQVTIGSLRSVVADQTSRRLSEGLGTVTALEVTYEVSAAGSNDLLSAVTALPPQRMLESIEREFGQRDLTIQLAAVDMQRPSMSSVVVARAAGGSSGGGSGGSPGGGSGGSPGGGSGEDTSPPRVGTASMSRKDCDPSVWVVVAGLLATISQAC